MGEVWVEGGRGTHASIPLWIGYDLKADRRKMQGVTVVAVCSTPCGPFLGDWSLDANMDGTLYVSTRGTVVSHCLW
jgi:hypothetical protein